MSAQTKISGLFNAIPKRPVDDQNSDKSPKRIKLDEDSLSSPNKENTSDNAENMDNNVNGNTQCTTPEKDNTDTSIDNGAGKPLVLSPEQKSKMEENRLKAMAKLLEKQSCGLTKDVGASWLRVLEPEFKKPYFQKLGSFVESERQKNKVFPTPENVFSWTRACTVDEVKVVILGQDPYHGINQAHGLSFSVLPGIQTPPSLLNMYKELETDIEGFKNPKHGYLQGWAKQGVLMLNAVMTVRAHQANSHKDKGWEKFTDATVAYLNKHRSGLVFMLWGSYAQKKGAYIDKKKHLVLTGVHPSPLSAHRGYFGCKHFSKCNAYLKENGKSEIHWRDLPVQ